MDADRYNGNVIEIIGGDCQEGNDQSMDQSMDQIFPPNWKEVVPRQKFPIPSFESFGSRVESSGSCFRGGPCKKFFTKEGCPWGDECAYFHDEEAKNRECVAITLCPGSYVRYADRGPPAAPATSQSLKPSNWRTRICMNWEQTGFCQYGSRCSFAHGAAELRVGREANPNNQGSRVTEVVAAPGSSSGRFVAPSNSSVVRAGGHEQVPGRERKKWRGPDRISNVYGDWIFE